MFHRLKATRTKLIKAPALPEGPKLNLGCGLDYREGYVNVDLHHSHKVDLVSDVSWLKEIEDSSCSQAVAQDVLEHMPRAMAETALREWNRVLKINGRVRIRVPGLVELSGLLSSSSNQTYAKQERLIHFLYGTQGYEGDFHLNGFTRLTLKHDLEKAGFVVASIKLYKKWLLDVVAYKIRHEPPDALLRVANDNEFIESAYTNLFNRQIDDGGKDYWIGVLKTGIARETVLRILRDSDEFKKSTKKRA